MEQIGTHWNNMEHFGTHQEGQRMQDTNQDKNQIAESEPQPLEPSAIYQNNIYALVDDVKELNQFKGLTDEELKNNKSFFPVLVDYIYNNYVGELLGNKNPKGKILYKDIQLLDDLFNIYANLIYLYKWNNRPSLIEFSIFTGINQNTFYEWVKGNNSNIDNGQAGEDKRRHLTNLYSEKVQRWQTICERALFDGNGEYVKEIFLLKARHNYKDSNPIEINVNHKQVITSEELPALIGVDNGKN